MTRRVVVTGLGVASALGMGVDAHLEGLREGRTAISQISSLPVEKLSIKIGAEIKGYDETKHFARSELSFLDKVSQLAVLAGREATQMAGWELSDEEAERAGVIVGCAMGGMTTLDENYHVLYNQERNRVHPFVVPRLMPNAPASQLSIQFGCKGPTMAITTACASSNHAIGQAFELVRSGGADIALTGGAEAQLTFGVLKAWEGLRVMSKDGCRPFSLNRNGMVQGEGAAVLVIESLERAKARGANILAELVGFGMSSDASDIVQPSQDGAARAMRAALLSAGAAPAEVEYINAHGTATAANDKTETAAIWQVFGEAADSLNVSSTKSAHGHCIGAAGAIEMAAAIMAVRDGVIAPTVNYEEPDPECDLNVTPNEAVERKVDLALSNSFAFGGLNAVVAVRGWRGA